MEEIKEKMPSMHCLKESVLNIQINMLMRKGFPLFTLFDDALTRIISAGFIDKWVMDEMEDKKRSSRQQEDYDSWIEFEDLIPAFYDCGGVPGGLYRLRHLSQPQAEQTFFGLAASTLAAQHLQLLVTMSSTFFGSDSAFSDKHAQPLPPLDEQLTQQSQHAEQEQHGQLRLLGRQQLQLQPAVQHPGSLGSTISKLPAACDSD
ncbi:hypothetical protein NQ318_013500 [Aromia moschata]|uniref:Uncharacterized protein n=1 Tax=Aromia moschata TaxID=1265417 RepID=A0AAV8YDM3_9CUCU|nr:hypothetical protein NQ318_013500 [Aromia moschata]